MKNADDFHELAELVEHMKRDHPDAVVPAGVIGDLPSVLYSVHAQAHDGSGG